MDMNNGKWLKRRLFFSYSNSNPGRLGGSHLSCRGLIKKTLSAGMKFPSRRHFALHTYSPLGETKGPLTASLWYSALSDNEPLSPPFLVWLLASFFFFPPSPFLSPLSLPRRPPLLARCRCLSLMASSVTVPRVGLGGPPPPLSQGTEGDNNVLMVPTATPRTDAAGAFIKVDMTHLLFAPPILHPAFPFLRTKREVLLFSKGVHSCHFSNANREPRNTSPPIVWCEQHRCTLARNGHTHSPVFPISAT